MPYKRKASSFLLPQKTGPGGAGASSVRARAGTSQESESEDRRTSGALLENLENKANAINLA